MLAPHEQSRFSAHQLPILLYHRIADGGPDGLSRWRVTPERFEKQLMFLKEHGYYSVGSDEWLASIRNDEPLSGRPLMITFDDGYQDFLDEAWPRLRDALRRRGLRSYR